MKRKKFRVSLIVLITVLFTLTGITFGSDLEESKYRKDFIVSKNTKIEVPKSTSGSIMFDLKGTYVVEILGDGSNMALNDAISSFKGKKEIFIGPKEISENYYRFRINFRKKRTYKIFYRTTTQAAKLTVKIRKIK